MRGTGTGLCVCVCVCLSVCLFPESVVVSHGRPKGQRQTTTRRQSRGGRLERSHAMRRVHRSMMSRFFVRTGAVCHCQ
ncbi:hypothetical protein LZ30DRAFT_699280 [Colletotrichum cereale]|nr:hypothetical protein LZ30DRAFT_699280 [Colletotrichum cereale]